MNESTLSVPLNRGSAADVHSVMASAQAAYLIFKKLGAGRRAVLLDAIALELEQARPDLVETARAETHLAESRLHGELSRTTNQLKLFSSLIREGSWVEATIDTPEKASGPGRPDLRKMLVPVGPVVVFGASNFPFAFSTAGGDTASALAAGSAVVIKAHPAHRITSWKVFQAMEKAMHSTGIPIATIQHVEEQGNSIGKLLVIHPLTTGVGFTGSFSGGKALMDYAAARDRPIPVFAEMSSVNPVVFYPDAMEKKAAEYATLFAGSITLGAGQFCTNPGMLIGVKSPGFTDFLSKLSAAIGAAMPQPMLHAGIHDNYEKGIHQLSGFKGVRLLAQSTTAPGELEAQPVLAQITGADMLRQPSLTHEIFGPFALAVVCDGMAELCQVLDLLQGQLTTTLIATDQDLTEYGSVIEKQQALAGRILLNNAPTGVEVCASMVHGGPFPATSDPRFTSVGTSAIKRWARPVCLQNFPDALLPDELKAANPLGIWRLVNNEFTRDPFTPA